MKSLLCALYACLIVVDDDVVVVIAAVAIFSRAFHSILFLMPADQMDSRPFRESRQRAHEEK